MTFVVAEPCIRCKYTDCVEVCPTDCFCEGENFLVIDPEDCIECGNCVDYCPIGAIFPEEDLPAKWSEYLALNARLATRWPRINKKLDPLPDAGEWSQVEGKRELLSERAAAR